MHFTSLKGDLLTITNFDPYSNEFLNSLPEDVGFIPKTGQSSKEIALFVNTVTSYLSVSFNKLFSVINKSKLDVPKLPKAAFNQMASVIEENSLVHPVDVKSVNLEVTITNHLKDQGDMFPEVVKILDEIVNKKDEVDVDQHITWPNNRLAILFTPKYNEVCSLRIRPINRFVYIPGKVLCYTFILNVVNASNIIRANSLIKEGGFVVNIWVCEQNFLTPPSLNYSKFKCNGNLYDIIKHHLAYQGFHLHPDGSISAKLKQGNIVSLVKLSPEAQYSFCELNFGRFNSCQTQSLLFGDFITRRGFCREVLGISIEIQSPRATTAPKAIIPTGIPESNGVKSMLSWWNNNLSGNPYYTSRYGISEIRTLTKLDFKDKRSPVGDFIQKYMEDILISENVAEVFLEHSELLSRETLSNEEFMSASNRSLAGGHILRGLDHAK